MGPSYLPEITLSDLDLSSLSGPEYSVRRFFCFLLAIGIFTF